MYKKVANLSILLLLVFHFPGFSQNVDVDILKAFNKHGSPFKDRFLELHASSVTYVSIGVPVIILAGGIIRHDQSLQRDGFFMTGSYLLSGGITRILKMACKRARPYERYSFIIKRDDEAGGYSFPSGHTSAAFNVATSLSLRFPKWQVVVPAYVYAGTVAWARLYQGVHYPSDVLAGALIGSGSAFILYRVQRSLEKKKYQQRQHEKALVTL
jgi:membrane-associated phospholipid phosphatase